MNYILKQIYSFNCNGKLLDFTIPKVMGILNITPDSFYDGGKYSNNEKILNQVERMLSEGADFIDVGAVSTRPGAKIPDVKEELRRLLPALEIIFKKYNNINISIDTFRSEVVDTVAKNFRICIINDVSGGGFDEKLFESVARNELAYVLMHIQNQPENMQNNPKYKNVVDEIIMYFSEKLEKLYSFGIKDIIIDPGFGFGKTLEHNYEILSKLENFRIFKQPILVGVSRKSMIYKLLNINSEKSLNATTIINTIALMKNAKILRVHGVKEAKEAIKIINML